MQKPLTRYSLARSAAREYVIAWLLDEAEHAEAFLDPSLTPAEQAAARAYLREIAAGMREAENASGISAGAPCARPSRHPLAPRPT